MASNFPLGRTQRDVFSNVLNRAQDAEPGGSSRQSPIDGTANREGTVQKEKGRFMPLKYLVFIIVVCGLLAGVIVAVVYGVKYLPKKDTKPRGITPGETPIVECPDVEILHGVKIAFACNFSKNEGVKNAWKNIDWVETKVDYPPSNVNKSAILCDGTDGYIMRCQSDNVTKATCSNNGKITLTLKTKTGIVTLSTAFAMILQEKRIGASASIANNVSGSVSVRCNVSGVCKAYQIHIYAYMTDKQKTRIDGPQLNCVSSFNNNNGHTIACTDEIKGDDIRKGKTRITCALMDGVNAEQEKEIEFPLCCEKKVHSGKIDCAQVCKADLNCTSTCPYCNKDIWCRTNTKSLITDRNSTFEICEAMKNC